MVEQQDFGFDEFNEGQVQREGFKVTFNEMQKRVHELAKDNGFWDCLHEKTDLVLPAKLALIHSEVSEALEADRNGAEAKAIYEELADIVIRVMDLAEAMNCDLASVIYEKHLLNMARPYKHNKKY